MLLNAKKKKIEQGRDMNIMYTTVISSSDFNLYLDLQDFSSTSVEFNNMLVTTKNLNNKVLCESEKVVHILINPRENF